MQYMIEKAFTHHGLDWRYLTVEVQPETLGDAVRGMKAMGFAGGHCGDRHKREIVPLLDRTSETADLVGAVNVISREEGELVGDSCEGKGLSTALGRLTDVKGKRVVLLGAGKAGRAAAVELTTIGVEHVTIVNRTEQHANDLARLLDERFRMPVTTVVWEGDYEVPPETELLINATSIGHKDADARVPVDLDTLRPEMIVADMTTDPPQTRLLREAKERGCQTVDGLTMYIDQVALAFNRWTGVAPDLDVMREAIEEFLEV